jgi:dihydroorotate dehydrogenase
MSALVYEGPGVAASINRGLARVLEADGVRHVREVVGVDA